MSRQFEISDRVRLEIHISAQSGAGQPFEIKQIENGEVVQIVSGTEGGECLTVTNYNNGIVTGVESIRIADRVKKTGGDAASDKGDDLGNTGPTGSIGIMGFGPGVNDHKLDGNGSNPLGTITYNKQGNTSSTGDYVEEQVTVYSELTSEADETRTIFGGINDTESIIEGIIIGAFFDIVLQASLVDLAANVILSFVKDVAVGTITGKYDVELTVRAYRYTMTAYLAGSSDYSVFYGEAQRVTVPGPHYDQWFYEGYTPDNWKFGDDMALDLWKTFFNAPFPGVKSYS